MPSSKLSLDKNNFPTLKTRKALLVIDCQNDFIAENGPLRVTDPEGYVENIVELASAFRPSGDVVWVRTEYGNRQIHQEDEIIVSNAPAGKPRGRPRSTQRATTITDAEAFLGIEGPKDLLCVRKGTEGAEFADKIQRAMNVRDRVFTKSHYSAFKSGELVGLLRMRFVTEIYLCGSLFNIGVFATAVDAARHGYEITLVDDCCGFRSPLRHSKAKKTVEEVTGCNIVNMEAAIKATNPEAWAARKKRLEELHGDGGGDDEICAGDIGYSRTADNANRDSEEEAQAESSKAPKAPKPPIVDVKGARDRSQESLVSSLSKLNLEGGEDVGEKAQSQPRTGGKAAQPQAATLVDSSKFDRQAPANNIAPSLSAGTDEKPSKISPDMGESTSDGKGGGDASREEGEENTATKQDGLENDSDIEIDISKLNLSGKKEQEEKHKQALSSNPKSQTETAGDLNPKDGSSTRDTPQPPASSSHHKTTTPKSAPSALASTPKPKEALPSAADTMAATEMFCEGDATIIHDLLPANLEDGIFEKLKTEVEWAKMSHQGGEVPRLVAVQGDVDEDGNQPIYRHPSDESPPLNAFTPTVRAIRDAVEKHLNHPLNHVLIQWYRDGHDYISEHSDKTLDISPGTFIANVSLGAQRTMVLRTKRQDKKHASADEKTTAAPGTPTSPTEGPRRQAVRVPLPHNSLFKMGLQTNMHWLHGIRQDKRADRDKTDAELAYSGARISLTFRQIGTYMNKTGKLIWGQGATGKTREQAHEVINGQTPEAIQMLKAFGTENHASEFEWKKYYGDGFDVLHMYAAARLFTSPDVTVNYRVQMMLAELGISYARGSMSSSTGKDPDADHTALLPTGTPIMFVDNDDTRTVVEDEMAIMTYLDQVYGDGKLRKGVKRTNEQLAQQMHRFHHAFHLGRWWREVCSQDENKNTRLGRLRKALAKFDAYLESDAEDAFICGKGVTITDAAFFPTLHEIVHDPRGGGVGILATFPRLKAYYDRFRKREITVSVFGNVQVEEETPAKKTVKKKQARTEEDEEGGNDVEGDDKTEGSD